MAKRERAATDKSAAAAGARERGGNFEGSLAALERVVRELERGDLSLERSLELFEQGVGLSRECQERLNEAERRIEVLLRDGEGRLSLSAFDVEDFEPRTEEGETEEDDDESIF